MLSSAFRLRAQGTYAITGNPEENCDVIQNGTEKVKTRVSFRLHAQETYVITSNPED